MYLNSSIDITDIKGIEYFFLIFLILYKGLFWSHL